MLSVTVSGEVELHEAPAPATSTSTEYEVPVRYGIPYRSTTVSICRAPSGTVLTSRASIGNCAYGT